MIDFFTSVACKSRAHCNTCRDEKRGAAFRNSVFGEKPQECPRGVPWGFKGKLVSAIDPRQTPFDIAKASIKAMPTESEAGKFLQSMLAQIEYLIKTKRCGSCGERRAYAKRMREKVVYLFEQYGLSSCNDSNHVTDG